MASTRDATNSADYDTVAAVQCSESMWPAPELQQTSADYDTVAAGQCSSRQISTLQTVNRLEMVSNGDSNRSRRQSLIQLGP